jgi:hypothetical protein
MNPFFQRMLSTTNPSEDCIWVPLPDHVQAVIRRWQLMLVQAVPVAKLNGNLCIGMMQGLFNFEKDLAAIIRTASSATPMPAMLTTLEARRINELETALAIRVDCPELCDLHERMTGVVSYPIDISGSYAPCVEIARFENPMLDIQVVDELEAAGIKGCKWIIDEIHAGTAVSFHPCACLGHAPLRFSVPDVGRGMFGKANGMSTLDMESGGLLMNPEFSIDIDDDDDEEEDDEPDDAWMTRALDLSESLDSEY